MQRYEYQVIPAPRRAEKMRGAKTPADRFAVTLSTVMNQMGRDGWEYLRADCLPTEERAGWTKRTLVEHHVLVFRRELASEVVRAPSIVTEAPETFAAPAANAPEGATPPIGPARAG